MHFPVGSKKCLNILGSKKIGGPVGTIQHANFPLIAVMGNQFFPKHAISAAIRRDNVQYIASKQCAPRVPPELSKGESGLATEITGHLKTALDCKIGTAAIACEFSELQQRAGFD